MNSAIISIVLIRHSYKLNPNLDVLYVYGNNTLLRKRITMIRQKYISVTHNENKNKIVHNQHNAKNAMTLRQ